MTTLLETTIWIHLSLGTLCLASGLAALTSAKRKGLHPRAGRTFAVVLLFVYLAILPNIFAKTNIFMLGIGWLAVYSAAVGWRALLRSRGRLPGTPQPLDLGINGLSVAISVVLVGFGGRVFAVKTNPMGLVCAGFGVLGLLLVWGARKRWRSETTSSQWLAAHIDHMCGAFSAALMAAFAINLSGKVGNLEWLLWVGPIVVMNTVAKREKRKRGLK